MTEENSLEKFIIRLELPSNTKEVVRSTLIGTHGFSSIHDLDLGDNPVTNDLDLALKDQLRKGELQAVKRLFTAGKSGDLNVGNSLSMPLSLDDITSMRQTVMNRRRKIAERRREIQAATIELRREHHAAVAEYVAKTAEAALRQEVDTSGVENAAREGLSQQRSTVSWASDEEPWTPADIIDLCIGCGLTHARHNGAVSGQYRPAKFRNEAFFSKSNYPCLELLQCDWKEAVLKPEYTFLFETTCTSLSQHTAAFREISASLKVEGDIGCMIQYSGALEAALDSTSGSVSQYSTFSTVTCAKACVCRVNLRNRIRVKPDVKAEFEAATKLPDLAAKQTKLEQLVKKYGAFVIVDVTFGVQGVGTYTGQASTTFQSSSLAATMTASASYSSLITSATMAAGMGLKEEEQNQLKTVRNEMTISVQGAPCAPSIEHLTDVCQFANNREYLTIVQVHAIEPIFSVMGLSLGNEFLPRVQLEQIDDGVQNLNNSDSLWRQYGQFSSRPECIRGVCKTFDSTKGRSGSTSQIQLTGQYTVAACTTTGNAKWACTSDFSITVNLDIWRPTTEATVSIFVGDIGRKYCIEVEDFERKNIAVIPEEDIGSFTTQRKLTRLVFKQRVNRVTYKIIPKGTPSDVVCYGCCYTSTGDSEAILTHCRSHTKAVNTGTNLIEYGDVILSTAASSTLEYQVHIPAKGFYEFAAMYTVPNKETTCIEGNLRPTTIDIGPHQAFIGQHATMGGPREHNAAEWFRWVYPMELDVGQHTVKFSCAAYLPHLVQFSLNPRPGWYNGRFPLVLNMKTPASPWSEVGKNGIVFNTEGFTNGIGYIEYDVQVPVWGRSDHWELFVRYANLCGGDGPTARWIDFTVSAGGSVLDKKAICRGWTGGWSATFTNFEATLPPLNEKAAYRLKFQSANSQPMPHLIECVLVSKNT